LLLVRNVRRSQRLMANRALAMMELARLDTNLLAQSLKAKPRTKVPTAPTIAKTSTSSTKPAATAAQSTKPSATSAPSASASTQPSAKRGPGRPRKSQ